MIGFDGKSCALALVAAATSAVVASAENRPVTRREIFIGLLPLVARRADHFASAG
jgi:hypothetical protein